MKRFMTTLVTSNIGSCVMGVVIGALVFRMPKWACGPFRSEVAAAWVGAAVAAIAAIATYWAVIVAMKVSRASLEAARLARELDAAQSDARRRDQSIIVARICIGELYSAIGQLTAWAAACGDAAIPVSDIFHQAAGLRIATLERYVDRFDVFDVEVATNFGSAVMRARGFVQHAKNYVDVSKNWTAKTQEDARKDLANTAQKTITATRLVYDAFLEISGAEPNPKKPEDAGQESYQAAHDRAVDAGKRH